MSRWLPTVLLLLATVASHLVVMDPARAGSDQRGGPKPADRERGRDACGELVPRTGGGTWRCTFSEPFDGTRLRRKHWVALTDRGEWNTFCTLDDPRTVAVDDGTLRLTLQRTDATLQCPKPKLGRAARYASASVSTYHRFSQRYGRFEARIRNTASDVRGLHEAFWLWPDTRYHDTSDWPASGEIDIAETYSQFPDLVVPFLHYGANDNGGPQPGLNTAWDCEVERGQWHTYTLVWSATRLRILVDGETCLLNKHGAASFRKRFIVSLSMLLGIKRNAPVFATPMPATMEVDYVRVWR